MGYVHGKKTVITVATKDLSTWTKNSSLERNADLHDLSGYGIDDRVHGGGLRTNKFTMSGSYDDTAATSPKGVLSGAVGTSLAIVRKAEGTGTGKPQETFNAILEKYVETAPFDDYISWTADFTLSGGVTSTTQP
jgi:hypothetical protein